MSNAEKAPPKFTLKLTREMRMAVVVLGFAGALGGWFVYNTSQAPAALDRTEEPLASTPLVDGESQPPAAAVTTEPEATPPGVSIATPNRAVTSPDVPFLTPNAPVAEPEAAPSTTATPAPAVRAQNLRNPFRPLSLPERDAPAVSVPAQAQPPTPPRAFQAQSAAPPVRVPQVSTLGGPSVPNIAGPIAVRPPSISGVMPLPVVPGTGGPIQAQGGPVQAQAVPVPSAPPAVPTPTVRAPSGTALAVRTPARDAQSDGSRAQPATPEVLRALQVETAAQPAQSQAQLISPLDAYVANQQVRYSAVVLGPVNTSIFATKAGYVVVALGQRLPDSEIVVKDISSTSVTLALGEQLKTLEIDKR